MTIVEEPPLDRKLVAILAADVEGYSRLMHKDEEGTLVTLTHHRSVVYELIADGRGRVCGSAGDSVLAEFASVVDAVRSAVAIQQAMAVANDALDPEKRMAFRIGINVGDVMVKDGSIFGDGVNVAARLEAISEAGGICITRGVRDHLRDRSDYEFEDLGEHVVKNIARPVRAFRVLFDPSAVAFFRSTNLVSTVEEPDLSLVQISTEETTTELLFWQTIQDSDTTDEYIAYLEKFPDGAFSDLARSRIENFESPTPDPADDTMELAFWKSVENSADPAMYHAYLQKYPQGGFSSLAEIWLSSQG